MSQQTWGSLTIIPLCKASTPPPGNPPLNPIKHGHRRCGTYKASAPSCYWQTASAARWVGFLMENRLFLICQVRVSFF